MPRALGVKNWGRPVLSALAVMLAAGCADYRVEAQRDVDDAVLALRQGNYPAAAAALRALPFNTPYTLALTGILYERTGRPDLAAETYRAALTDHDTETLSTVIPAGLTEAGRPLTVRDFLHRRLDVLFGRTPQAWQSATTRVVAVGRNAGRPVGEEGTVRLSTNTAGAGAVEAVLESATDRFETLRHLLKAGLVTEDEYKARRETNLGGLLPLTQPAPAAGLGRPAPPHGQVVDRLQTMREEVERGALSAQQQALERQRILDALLPADPALRDRLVKPPFTQAQVRFMLDRLERLQSERLVSARAAGRERAAVRRARTSAAAATYSSPAEGVVPPAGFLEEVAVVEEYRPTRTPSRMLTPETIIGAHGRMPPDMMTAPLPEVGSPPPRSVPRDPVRSTAGWGVHLASFNNRDDWRTGWQRISGTLGSALGGLQPQMVEAEDSDGTTIYRLVMGPLPNQAAAASVCQRATAAGEYCAPYQLR